MYFRFFASQILDERINYEDLISFAGSHENFYVYDQLRTSHRFTWKKLSFQHDYLVTFRDFNDNEAIFHVD